MAIFGTIEQLKSQVSHKGIALALDFLERFDSKKEFEGMKCGDSRRIVIEGERMYANLQIYNPKDWSKLTFEGHKKYIDIQCLFAGEEKILHAGIQRITKMGEYFDDKDYHFSEVDRYSEILITSGDACVLYPTDMHAPCMLAENNSEIKKVVVKVLCDWK